MRTSYNILWSEEAKFQLTKIVAYLRKEWSEKEVNQFISKLRSFEKIVVTFPEIYPESKSGLRRAVITKHNSVIYQIDKGKNLIRVFTIFDNPQHPDKLK